MLCGADRWQRAETVLSVQRRPSYLNQLLSYFIPVLSQTAGVGQFRIGQYARSSSTKLRKHARACFSNNAPVTSPDAQKRSCSPDQRGLQNITGVPQGQGAASPS